MTVLSVVSDALAICGHAEPATVVNSANPTVKRMSALLRVEGDVLTLYHSWRTLKVGAFITGDGTSTLFDLPSDYTKFSPGIVMWEEGGYDHTINSISDEQMLAAKSRNIEPLNPVWRLVGDQIEFYPALATGQVINFEYRSDYWLADQTLTTRKKRATADTDVLLIPEQVVMLGLVWRFKSALGLNYEEDFRTYQMERERYVFNDTPRNSIRVGGQRLHAGLAVGVYGDEPPVVVP